MSRSPALPLYGVVVAAMALAGEAPAAPLDVRHPEGSLHGFLVLRDLQGAELAEGDLEQRVNGTRITSRLALRFRDGSSHEETVEFTQQRQFRLLRDHVVQRGPSFPNAVDTTIDAAAGRVTIAGTAHRVHMPADIANGLVSIVLKNARPANAPLTLSVIVPSPKPALAHVVLTPDGDEEFGIGESRRTAHRYVASVKLAGIAKILAPLEGKSPHDYRLWIVDGPAPSVLRSEGPLYAGGPVWRIELASPRWR
jgi:hypothetical protein